MQNFPFTSPEASLNINIVLINLKYCTNIVRIKKKCYLWLSKIFFFIFILKWHISCNIYLTKMLSKYLDNI